MSLVNQHDKVVAEHLTECFIDHRRVRLAAQGIPKLALQHAEGRFRVGTLVIVLQKLFPFVHEVMEHLLIQSTRHPPQLRCIPVHLR